MRGGVCRLCFRLTAAAASRRHDRGGRVYARRSDHGGMGRGLRQLHRGHCQLQLRWLRRGIQGHRGGLVDFGASDAPLSVYSTPPCNNCVQMPWALSGVGISYHINGLKLPRGKALHLTGSVISAIYLGQIKNWDAPQITALNPGAHIPSTPISVFWRSDGSGTTYTFSRYESDVSSAFASKVGASTVVSFPIGTARKGIRAWRPRPSRRTARSPTSKSPT